MDSDKLNKILDELLDQRNQAGFKHHYIENLIAKHQKPTKKNSKPQPQTRKLKENPPGSGNYQ